MDPNKIHNQNHFIGLSFKKNIATAIANKIVDAKLIYNFVLIPIRLHSSIILQYIVTLHFSSLLCTLVKHILSRHVFHTNHVFF